MLLGVEVAALGGRVWVRSLHSQGPPLCSSRPRGECAGTGVPSVLGARLLSEHLRAGGTLAATGLRQRASGEAASLHSTDDRH